MTDRPTAPQMPESDPLLARYHRATDLSGQPARPAVAVRERILAQAQARLQPQADAAAAIGSGRPAANESRWKLRALASMMVVSLAGLLAWQVERAPDEPPPGNSPLVAAPAKAPLPARTMPPASDERVGREAVPVAPAAAPPAASVRSPLPAPAPQPSTHRAAARQAAQVPEPLPPPQAMDDPAHSTAGTRPPAPQEIAPRPRPFALPAPAATAPGPQAEATATPEAPALSRGPLREQRMTLDKHAGEGSAAQDAGPSAAAVPRLSLWQAAAEGRPGDVRAALSGGASPNALDPQGRTPLVLAASLGDGSERYAEVAQALLDAGADPGLTDRQGLSAIDHARQRGQEALLGILTTPVR